MWPGDPPLTTPIMRPDLLNPLFAEVAVALDVPVGTVKTRLMHARDKLRAALGGNES